MRLLDMGVQDYLLTSAVIGIQAQRLVRTLCEHCREPYTPTDTVVQRWDLERFSDGKSPTLYRATGCQHCGGTGYSGRIAILEILMMTDEIRELVLQRKSAGDIAATAQAQSMVSMCDDGLRKAARGLTTIEEVLRVVPDTAGSGEQ
jgi:general secretion pathway protein E